MLTALDTLAHELADGTARADIECNCRLVEWGPPSYYDTAIEDAEIREEWLSRALAYLDGRGLLLRYPSNHAWVAIKDAPEQAGGQIA